VVGKPEGRRALGKVGLAGKITVKQISLKETREL
jgi:hypothetical protein